jgi:two-component system KDP operon response regulator KdpE
VTSGGATVVVVEDELQMRRFIRASLESHGFRVQEAALGASGEALVASPNPDLILLDLGLPDGDGIDLTRRLRAITRAPILVISARGREADKVEALDAGADDYLTKPFGVKELLARMRACLRRASGADATGTPLALGRLTIDLEQRGVCVAGAPVRLTPIEYRLLSLLARNAGRVLTHARILTEVWGAAYSGHTHYVRVHMAELRRKLELDPARPSLIVTEPGVGYRLRPPSDE